MNKGTVSIAFLLVGLLGGLVLVADLWVKNAPEPPAAGAPISSTSTTSLLPTLNGVIAAGEYAHSLHDKATGMDLSWSIVGKKIYFGLHSPGKGWLALGLAPEGPAMKGAEIMMGFVKKGQAYMQDEFGNTPYTHEPVTKAGETADLIKFAGAEDAQGTTLEFARLLNPGGKDQKSIVPGVMTIMLAYADKDDWTTYHRQRSEVKLDLFAPGK
ncbi:MAG TPA: hypothetical protein ENI60_00470 [Candidatus Fraserbacteria bacterium]|nr:hypothetical protein [Candidatus Fraserbacteria bacterium]